MENKNLVATCFHNGLGNFVMFSPALKALSELYDAKIDLYLDKKWSDSRRESVEVLFSNMTYANNIIDFDKNKFNKNKYKALYWTSHGEPYECHAFFKENANLKAVFDDGDDNWMHTKEHEIDFYMNTLFENGYKYKVPKQLSGFTKKFIRTHRIGSNPRISTRDTQSMVKIGFCNGYFPGTTWNWSRKAWPYFDELAILIKNYFGDRSIIHLLGKGKDEIKWAKDIVKTIKSYNYNAINSVDRFGILATIRKISGLDVLISSDTGLMHIADALGVPLIVIFGSTLASKNGPYRRLNVKLVQSFLGCAPCQNTPKFFLCKDFECMRDITPACVFGQLLTLLEEMGYAYS